LSNVLFIDVFSGRVHKWTEELQNVIECESIESGENNRSPSISDLPDGKFLG